MKTYITYWLIGLMVFAMLVNLQAQTDTISGQVNLYRNVAAIDTCSRVVTLSNAFQYNVGDRVVIIQMNGASMNETNTSSFGTITSFNKAGNYEINEISVKNSVNLTMKYPFKNSYDVSEDVQLVKVAVYNNAVVNGNVTAKDWTGSNGGVVVLELSGKLTLIADIDATGAGFSGGADGVNVDNCGWANTISDYHYTYSSQLWAGAWKGEGIADYVTGKELGRGTQTIGGGGGNDHNSGGGGGGHAGAGGNGGQRANEGFFDCKGDYPGIGGRTITYSSGTRVFMGGGGGSGHRNNAISAPGANGGGIVIIVANQIESLGGDILAVGDKAATASGDGAGGGGAGGAIFLDANTYTGTFTINASGGEGGDLFNPSPYCMGPGGGGGAGIIWSTGSSFPGTVSTSVVGGARGQTINNDAASNCLSGNPNNTQAGSAGVIQYNLNLNFASDVFPPGPYTWTGAVDTNWFSQCNWNKLAIPTDTIMAIVPSGLTNYPTISGDTAKCKFLQVDASNGAKVRLDVPNVVT